MEVSGETFGVDSEAAVMLPVSTSGVLPPGSRRRAVVSLTTDRIRALIVCPIRRDSYAGESELPELAGAGVTGVISVMLIEPKR
jgi:hypothetical protein